jgi:hypothetical protein
MMHPHHTHFDHEGGDSMVIHNVDIHLQHDVVLQPREPHSAPENMLLSLLSSPEHYF